MRFVVSSKGRYFLLVGVRQSEIMRRITEDDGGEADGDSEDESRQSIVEMR
jgi:hypothetical protein